MVEDTGEYLILTNTIVTSPLSNRSDIFLYGGNDEFPEYTVDKQVYLKNVVFDYPIKLINFKFEETVKILNTLFPPIINCEFQKELEIKIDESELFEKHKWNILNYRFPSSLDEDLFWKQEPFLLEECKFNYPLNIDISVSEATSFSFRKNSFIQKRKFEDSQHSETYKYPLKFKLSNIEKFDFSNNKLESTYNSIQIILNKISQIRVQGNEFHVKLCGFNLKSRYEKSHLSVDGPEMDNSNLRRVIVEDNLFNSPVYWTPIRLDSEDYINWENWDEKLFFSNGAISILESNFLQSTKKDSIIQKYLDTIVSNQKLYNSVIANYGLFLEHYKTQHNHEWSNLVFNNIKNLQTERYKYQYNTNKTFSSFFRWKVNQFIKIFSKYGTEPSRAIVIAVYVIFIFAFIYLFFPNSWDENNKHRIINRMLFFTKYFSIKEGMKEVYEEDNRANVLAYEDFKNYLEKNRTNIPPYFISLSKPIYTLSVANYRIRSKILGRADILKGKWSELHPRRKAVTSIIMAFWLLGILLYDLFVKFFNALMLSINTFSTLGFGEIPIKGIPRYLAILQGFLGWFMLSIFSVSLISQLLN